jgi:DNA mismatch endonuclease, patch repair protein
MKVELAESLVFDDRWKQRRMDRFSPAKRSEIMSRVRSKDTRAETIVRSFLHRLGYRFRLHSKDLPGRPDIVLPRHRAIIFVHGCFWHQHHGCPKATLPESNRERWDSKLNRNVERDKANEDALRNAGWNVAVIWECELKNVDTIVGSLSHALPGLRARL